MAILSLPWTRTLAFAQAREDDERDGDLGALLDRLAGGDLDALADVESGPAGVPAIDPLTGKARVYERHDDGSVELSVATSEAILRSIVPVGFMSQDALYRWRLPAP